MLQNTPLVELCTGSKEMNRHDNREEERKYYERLMAVYLEHIKKKKIPVKTSAVPPPSLENVFLLDAD